ncbi:RNA polymerase ECF-subfamily sigma-70 factor [Pseudomonas aeruginosa]|nr:RNA polymerase ECF-subfamily sigma-70 factor [Pseudomonas aeruginosa]
MVRWMTSALPPTVTGASRRTPGTRIRRKPCSPRANCAIAWTRPLNGLSELQRSVLTLRERQGLELEEIRDLLDITLSNVRVLLHRAPA